MATYQDLSVNHYYLIREEEGEEMELVAVWMHSQTSVCLASYGEYAGLFWKLKDDEIFEVVEELTEEDAEKWEMVYNAYHLDEEDDEPWEENWEEEEE